MDIKEKIMSYFANIEGYDYNRLEHNADYIFENAMKYNNKILTVIPSKDKDFFKNIFKMSLCHISEKNIDTMLNFLKNKMKHKKSIKKEMLGNLKSNKNLTLSQLRDICSIESYCKSPKPSKLRYELKILQDCDKEIINIQNLPHCKY